MAVLDIIIIIIIINAALKCLCPCAYCIKEFGHVDWRTTEEIIPAGRWACLARCGRLLAIVGTTGLLLERATYCSATKRRLPMSRFSSST